MRALNIHAGPAARRHLEQHGLRPQDVRVIPAAAGGPKGLILGPLDQFLFGHWLAQSRQEVHLLGASIGAWRMATACLDDPVAAFQRLEHDYIHQHFELPPGQRRPSARQVSTQFGRSLQDFYGGRVAEVLAHPRYRVHIVTSRGRGLLGREHALGTPLGYLAAFVANAGRRKSMGRWLERVVFSAPQAGQIGSSCAPLPFLANDYRTRQVPLDLLNFNAALQASCSIPFVLQAVQQIPGAPPGAYWDGGITDYHLHLNYPGFAPKSGAENQEPSRAEGMNGLVLYPHFQRAVVPGWLDKGLKWRHKPSRFLDTTVLLVPNPQWVRSLPNAKLPDRTDFTRYGQNLAARVQVWTQAVRSAQQLAEEFQTWLERPDLSQVQAL